MQITGPKTRQAILVPGEYDPAIPPERLSLFKEDGTAIDSSSVAAPPAIARTPLILNGGIIVTAPGFPVNALKLASGEVHVEGLLSNISGGTLGADSLIGRLPNAAMYPRVGTGRVFFCGVSDGTLRRFDISDTGYITLVTGNWTNNAWVSLEPMRFYP